jgi:hypothetical protein
MTPEEREALFARNPALALAVARGIRSRDESHAAAIGTGSNAASIGAPDPRAVTPPPPSSPYDYNDSRANRTPGASDVTAFGQLGFQNIWTEEREYVLQHASSDGYPFDTVSVPPGLNRRLTQAEANALNARYGGGQP